MQMGTGINKCMEINNKISKYHVLASGEYHQHTEKHNLGGIT